MKTPTLPGLGKAAAEEEPDDLEDAMSDLGAALSSKDWGAAALAFRRAKEVCGDDYDDEDEASIEE
jgi:hypothetical protein